jgi:hypothetical protein
MKHLFLITLAVTERKSLPKAGANSLSFVVKSSVHLNR